MADSTDSKKRKWDQPGDAADGGDSKAARVDAADAAAIAARLAKQFDQASKQPEEPVEEAAFVKDIEINDVRNRYLLTKGSTQDEIKQATGASVSTKGHWYPDKSMATEKDPPLYLHIAADTKLALDKAVEEVMKLVDQDLGPLVAIPGQRKQLNKWPEAKVFIGLDSLRNFNIRAKVVGPQGLFVKHISSETGCKVQIKGQGSGFVETETGRESEEPLHVFLSGPDSNMVERARELAEDLITVVREEHAKAVVALNGGSTGLNYYPPGYAMQQAGYQPPLPSDAAPAPPTDGHAPPPPSGGDPSAQAAQGSYPPADPAMTQYYVSMGYAPEVAAYYAQMQAYYAMYGYPQGQDPNAQGTPGQGPPGGGEAQRVGHGQYGNMPPPAGL